MKQRKRRGKTAKERVLAEARFAYCKCLYPGYYKILPGLSATMPTPRQAWQDAAKRLRGKRR